MTRYAILATVELAVDAAAFPDIVAQDELSVTGSPVFKAIADVLSQVP